VSQVGFGASAKIRRQYAEFLWRQGHARRARTQFEHALQIAPERAKLRVDVANFHWNQGNQDVVAAQFETAVELDEEPPSFKNRRVQRSGMFVLLESHVNAGVINAAGLILTLGGILLTALWWRYLYR
jgi:hypothetical protein